jgi:hypothetical protein
MNLYVDLATRRIVFSPKLNKEIARVDVKRGDVFPLSIVFLSNGKPVQIATGSEIVFCAKKKNDFEGDALVLTESFTLTNANTDNPSYDGVINLNSDNLADYLDNAANTADDFIFADLHSEINWSNVNEAFTTNTLILRVYNDIYKGDEGDPVITPGAPFVFPDGLQTATIAGINGGPVTINATLVASHIHGNLAGTLYTHVRTGEAMTKGDPFYISGYHNGDGGYPIVRKAKASDPTKMPAIGVMDASYAANVNGANGIISGTISGINTGGFVVNKPVYVGGDGGYSTIAGDIAQQIGITERANNSTGAFIVTNAKRDPIERFRVLTEADLVTIDGSQVFNLTTQGVYTISSLPEEVWSGIVVIPSADSGQYVVINQSNYDGVIHAGIGNLIADLFFGKRVTLFFDYGGALAWNVSESTGSAVGIREAKTDNPDGIPDALTDGTISGVTVFSDGSFVYDGGAAAAHRTALGLTTLATTTAGTNVANFLEFPTSANLASALTDENGTGGGFVRAEGATLTSPSIAGTASFTGTTRPTSAGTGTPAATSLMTRDDVALEPFYNLGSVFRVSATPVFANSGTGSSSATQSAGDRWAGLSSGTANSGWARAQIGRGITTVPSLSGAGINFASKLGVSIVLWLANSAATDNLNIFRLRFGSDNTPVADGVDAVAYRGFGVEIKARGSSHDWRVYGHNGTSITYSAWSNTGLTADLLRTRIFLSVMSNGSGTITASLGANGSRTLSTITTTGGPTTSGTSAQSYIEVHVANSASGVLSLSAALYDAMFYAQT